MLLALPQLFEEIDINGNGRVDAEELRAFLEHAHDVHKEESNRGREGELMMTSTSVKCCAVGYETGQCSQ